MAKVPATLPLHVRTDIGGAKGLLIAAVVIGLLRGAPFLIELSQGVPLMEILTSAQFAILGGICVLCAVIVVLTRNVATLDVDENGVVVVSKKQRYLYAWSDIAHVVKVSKGLRLEMRGHTDSENQYNFITERFGVPLDQLTTLLREGVERWGSHPGEGAGASFGRRVTPGIESVTPSDNPGKAASDAFRTMATVMGAGFALLFAGVLFWQVTEYNKAVHLQRNGVRAEAAVVRIVDDSCGRGGCSKAVDYTFQAAPGSASAGKTVQGHAYLTGSSDTGNPRYLYATSKHTVPIAYDRTDPNRSDLNFDDRVFHADPLGLLLTIVGIVGGTTVVFGGGMLALIYFSLRKAMTKQPAPLPLGHVA